MPGESAPPGGNSDYLAGPAAGPPGPPDPGGAGDGVAGEDAVCPRPGRPGKVLWAAFRAGLDKLRGIRGTFYRLLGPEVRGLDGFYGGDIPAYADLGIRIPAEPDKLCDQVYEQTGIVSYIVDANGLGVELLGKASVIRESEEWLTGVIRDNPAGQERQLTPFILVRKKSREETNPADA